MNINDKTLPLIIVGASGFGKEVAWLAESCCVPVLGFVDDNTNLINSKCYNYEVIGNLNSLMELKKFQLIIAVGDPRIRKKIILKLQKINDFKYATLVHPNVKISKSVTIQEGSVICANSILTVDINIGKHCHINLATTIGHDTIMGDYCTTAPQTIISGNVVIDNGVEIGTGAAIKQGIKLENGSMLGMGSVLTKNMDRNYIYLGSPARKFKPLNEF